MLKNPENDMFTDYKFCQSAPNLSSLLYTSLLSVSFLYIPDSSNFTQLHNEILYEDFVIETASERREWAEMSGILTLSNTTDLKNKSS